MSPEGEVSKVEGRRVAAIVMPRLFVEIVELSRARARDVPLAVLLDPSGNGPPRGGASRNESGASSEPIFAINEAAASRGVRVGQTLAEASAYAARLSVVHLDEGRVFATLHAIADIALSFGPTVEVDYESLDTVWVDVTGSAHLFDGEEALRLDLEDRLRAVGFTANAAIADGPRVARALARHAGVSVSISKRGESASAMAPLPVGALFAGASELHALFVRLGVFTIEDFVKLPFSQISSRAGAVAKEILALAMGHDPRPLTPYRAPDVLFDEVSFDDGVEQSEALLFALRGVTSRLAARLAGRAQATNHIEILLRYDRSIHRLRGAEQGSSAPGRAAEGVEIEPILREMVELPAPLSSEGDLFRTVKAKIEQISLAAPAVSISLTLSRIVSAPRVQLDLSRDVSVSPDALPALVSELTADLGEDRVGVLAVVDSHRPEARSKLVSFMSVPQTSPSVMPADPSAPEPTRLFVRPVPIGAIEAGATIFVGRDAFEIESVAFDRRLEGVEWWSPSPLFRDYVNVSLVRSMGAGLLGRGDGVRATMQTSAWAYVDRKTGEAFLQGLWE